MMTGIHRFPHTRWVTAELKHFLWKTGMRRQGFSDHTRGGHLTFGGLSGGALKHYLQRSWRLKYVCIGCLAVSWVRRNKSLCECFRCHVRSPMCNRSNGGFQTALWQIWTGCEDARAFCPAIWSHTIKHNRGARLSWTDLAVAINPCMWKCLRRLHLIHLEFWIIVLMYRKYTAWSQHDN